MLFQSLSMDCKRSMLSIIISCFLYHEVVFVSKGFEINIALFNCMIDSGAAIINCHTSSC